MCLVPAHNEQDNIANTIRSLLSQTRTPDLVIVIADNCTDDTVAIARTCDVTVMETSGNQDKKAGALNQAFAECLEFLGDDDAVLVMDADTNLDDSFLFFAEAQLDAGFAAVGGTFTGDPGAGFVGMLQRNEYARYARDVGRRKGKALVLTGTATVLTVAALNSVLRARAQGWLPGPVEVYDTHVLTEDNELTLALLHLGWPIIAPQECHMTTEVMGTWGDLYRQRLRWKRGALENLVDYGWTKITAKYWARQLWTFIGCLVTTAYVLSLLISLTSDHMIRLHPLWLAVTAIFAIERVITVRSRGVWQMLVSAVLIVEMPYDLYLQAVHGKALFDVAMRRERAW